MQTRSSHTESNGASSGQATLPTVNGESETFHGDRLASNGLTLHVEQLNTMSQTELIDMLTEVVGLSNSDI